MNELNALPKPGEEWPDDGRLDSLREKVNEAEKAQREKYGILDWSTFWSEEVVERDWLVEGFLQRGQHGVVYSLPGLGKSLLTLELALLLSLGETTLGKGKVDPIKVLYIDMENSLADVRDRMQAWGMKPTTPLGNLHYSLLGEWFPLNTKRGGEELVRYCQTHEIALVCIDTTSRVVDGDVNNATVIGDLWNQTQVHLKRMGVSVIRIDHSGKDADRGQLGSVMKSADQDMIWRLVTAGDHVAIECEKDRSNVIGVGGKVLLRRTSNPLRHVVNESVSDAFFDDIDAESRILAKLTELGIHQQAGRPTIEKALRDSGFGRLPDSTTLGDIVKRRRAGGGV